jgi:hypothetical protein
MQQATCAHSGASTGTSPQKFELNSSPSRRAVLGFAGGATVLALSGSGASAATPITNRWDELLARYEASANAASAYWEHTYQPQCERIDAMVGKMPSLWIEHRTASGECFRVNVDPLCTDPPQTFLVEERREVIRKWTEWSDRYRGIDRDPAFASVTVRMDELWAVEDSARTALMDEPAPTVRALAIKVKLAFANDEMWETDRDALLVDVARLTAVPS